MMNPMQLMQMIRGGGNPQQAIINMMKQQSGNNPVIDNAINMMEKGDNAGIEKLARNLCKERNITLSKLATLSAVSPSSIKSIFYGKSMNPKILTIKKLCDGLDITLGEFFSTPEFDELEQEIK